MNSVQNLRELINERLTAAAEEIFTEFEKTIVQYEEEIDRQRRLLDNMWKVEIKFHTTDLQQNVQKENVVAEQNLCNQERNSNVDQEDPEPRQMKEEQEELCTSQEGEHLVLMEEADTLVQCNSNCEDISREIFRISDKRLSQLDEDIDDQRRLKDMIWKPRIMLHKIDHQHQDVCKGGNGLPNQHLCNQENKLHLDQKDAEPPRIIEDQEELSLSHQRKQIVLNQATDTLLSISTDMDSDLSELKPNSDHLLSYNSPVSKSPHQDGSKLEDSCSTRNTTPKPKSHSSCNVAKSSMSEHHCDVDTSEKSLKCDVFENIFKNTYQIKKHHQIHKGVKPNACNPCRRSFSSWSQRKVHMKIHTDEKRYSCETCGKHFSRSNHLTVHMRTHTSERPYSCERCGKTFHKRSKLTTHMRAHTGERPYSCERCGKHFTQRGQLTVHMRTHTGEKPYSCETCGKHFTECGKLTVHMRTHTGERLHFCETCGKRFSRNSHLTVHMRVHTGEKPYSCETCGKNFTQRGQLTVHMRTHTGEKPYCCETCGKRYTRNSHLISHKNSHR
ncbi:zinc finger protein 391-like isoform X2 [Acanthochromis polyacanthus]|uniref:zinc finger protein 391-like isoform X2 n=1 Tax=Acanthochromis polyacanthus TaxID=80966 RepID=UPI0022348CC3|nr:zinc finger protein 391-like isoform X2 [Acanthochromis polyacanthus]